MSDHSNARAEEPHDPVYHDERMAVPGRPTLTIAVRLFILALLIWFIASTAAILYLVDFVVSNRSAINNLSSDQAANRVARNSQQAELQAQVDAKFHTIVCTFVAPYPPDGAGIDALRKEFNCPAHVPGSTAHPTVTPTASASVRPRPSTFSSPRAFGPTPTPTVTRATSTPAVTPPVSPTAPSPICRLIRIPVVCS